MLNKNFKVIGGNSKRPLIIGISIAAAILVIAAIIVAIILLGGNDSNPNVEPNQTQQPGVNYTPGAPEKEALVDIQITQAPHKTSYYCGEELELDGLSVFGMSKAEQFLKLDLTKCQITGFDSSEPVAKQTITVTYEGFTDTFFVEIKEAPKLVGNPVVSIEFETLPKTQYKLNERPDLSGAVLLCTYADGTTKNVELDPAWVYGFATALRSGVGEYDITVKYTEDDVTVETTYKITITE